MKNRIKMKKGYPTSDGVMHDKYVDAIRSQTLIDLVDTCKKEGIDEKMIIEFLKNNSVVVSDYIARHIVKNKAVKK